MSIAKQATTMALRDIHTADKVEMIHFEKALKMVPPTITSSMLETYENSNNKAKLTINIIARMVRLFVEAHQAIMWWRFPVLHNNKGITAMEIEFGHSELKWSTYQAENEPQFSI
ncbi:hypothetical protein BDC45DRAFT_537077 [Circinella umbellata]|nr:hypothetical protein BDC45DRAFT_537077 [Circinella umbellata]